MTNLKSSILKLQLNILNMASATSPAILKALSALVNDSLNYVSLVEYMDEHYYLVLGRFSFYFIKNDLSDC